MFGGISGASAVEYARRICNPTQWMWDAEALLERAKKELREAEKNLADARRAQQCGYWAIGGRQVKRDKYDLAASFIVEEHIRIHGKMVPHPDKIKDAIADELRSTWNAAIDAAEAVVKTCSFR